MTEKKPTTLPFASDNPDEQKLWAALEDLPRESPPPEMRREFYRQLKVTKPTSWLSRLQSLGVSGNMGWLTVPVCVLLGVGLGLTINLSDSQEPTRLQVLEQQVARLNKELILDRLQSHSAGMRLRGVIDAKDLVQKDIEIAQALLLLATKDRISAVRSAAIDTLGSRLNSSELGAEILKLLEGAESPLVQLALVDLVLRNGNSSQLKHLRRLANEGRLHADLIKHVNSSLRSKTI